MNKALVWLANYLAERHFEDLFTDSSVSSDRVMREIAREREDNERRFYKIGEAHGQADRRIEPSGKSY